MRKTTRYQLLENAHVLFKKPCLTFNDLKF